MILSLLVVLLLEQPDRPSDGIREEPEAEEPRHCIRELPVLATWLSRKLRESDRYGFAATAEVKELGSWSEEVLITRDLSAGGCFVKTRGPAS